MKDQFKTKQELIREISALTQRIRELEVSESKHKQVNNALRENELKNRRIIENTRDLIYITDKKGFLTYMNPNLDQTLGYAHEEWNGQLFTLVFAPEYIASAKAIFKRAMKGETIPIYTTEMIKKDGTRIPVEVNITTLHDPDGKFAGRYCIGRDITKRKQAEDALRESELKYRQLIEITRDFIYVTDGKGDLVYINPTLDKTMGYAYQEWHGQPYTLLFAPEYVETAKSIFRRAMKGENIPVYDTEMIKKDGTRIPVEVNITTLHDSKGNFAGRYCIGRDITKRKQIEKELRELGSKYMTIFENTGTATVIVEADKVISLVNTEFESITGYPRQEIEGKKKWTEFVVAEDKKWMEGQHALRRINAGTARINYEFRLVDKDGRIKDMYINVDMIPGTEKSVASFLDLTERKRAEETLRESEEKYRQLYENMTEGVALHELIVNESGQAVDYRIIDINPAYCKQTGISPERSRGVLASILYGTNAPPYLEEYQHVAVTGEPLAFETFFPPLNKHFRIAVISPKRGFFATIFEDITERKQIEEELRIARDTYRNIFLNSQIGLFRTDMHTGMLLDANNSMAQLMGYQDRESLLAKPFNVVERYVDQDDRKKMISLLQDHGEFNTFEARLRKNDDSIIWMLVSARIFKKKGWIEGVSEDITARKQAEEALRESEEKYRNIFEGAIEGIYQTTPEGRYININPAFAKMFGFASPQEMIDYTTNIGQQLYVNPKDREEMVRMLRERDKVDGYEVEVYRKDRSRFWISINSHAVRDPVGNILYFEGTNIDITERKKMDEELKTLVSNLQKALEEIKTLKGIVPICACCKKIRNDKGFWEQVEAYVAKHTEAQFSHGICPDCVKELYPEFINDKKTDENK